MFRKDSSDHGQRPQAVLDICKAVLERIRRVPLHNLLSRPPPVARTGDRDRHIERFARTLETRVFNRSLSGGSVYRIGSFRLATYGQLLITVHGVMYLLRDAPK